MIRCCALTIGLLSLSAQAYSQQSHDPERDHRHLELSPMVGSTCDDQAGEKLRSNFGTAIYAAQESSRTGDLAAVRSSLDAAEREVETSRERWIVAMLEWNLAWKTRSTSRLSALWEPLFEVCYTPEHAAELRRLIENPSLFAAMRQ